MSDSDTNDAPDQGSGSVENKESAVTTLGVDLVKAKESYKKHIDACTDETESKRLQAILDEINSRIKDRDNREVVEIDTKHVPQEIPISGGKITIGPPTLTRFEKARIMGARALQLSLGAPPFIPIPDTATTSLDIAMKELNLRAIPIIIRRVLPNGDFQNIPITTVC